MLQWPRSLTRPPSLPPNGKKYYSRFLVGIYIAEPPKPPQRPPRSSMPTNGTLALTLSRGLHVVTVSLWLVKVGAVQSIGALGRCIRFDGVAYGPHAQKNSENRHWAGRRHLILGTGGCHLLRRVLGYIAPHICIRVVRSLGTIQVSRAHARLLCSSVPRSSSCPHSITHCTPLALQKTNFRWPPGAWAMFVPELHFFILVSPSRRDDIPPWRPSCR